MYLNIIHFHQVVRTDSRYVQKLAETRDDFPMWLYRNPDEESPGEVSEHPVTDQQVLSPIQVTILIYLFG